MVHKPNATMSGETHGHPESKKRVSKNKVLQLLLAFVGVVFVIADLESASASVRKTMGLSSSVLTRNVNREPNGTTIAKSVRTIDTQKGGIHPPNDDKYTCVSLDKDAVDTTSHSIDFDSLLNIRNGTAQAQVYLVMAAKAAGTTSKDFAQECFPGTYHVDNFINDPNNHLKPFVVSQPQPPKVVASHLYHANTLIDLIRWTSRDSVIIYLYREDTDRLLSSIKYMARVRWCTNTEANPWLRVKNDGWCIMEETPLMNTIGLQTNEIKHSTHSHLTCPVWDEIQTTMPKLVFLHYSQSDALQRQLATHYCPNLLPRLPLRSNVAAESHSKYMVKTAAGGGVPLGEWLNAKRNLLEYSLRIGGVECKRQIRTVEDILRDPQQCPSRALLVR